MRTRLLRALCVALLCGAWAGAETLDEAVARLTKAAAETRDVTIKYTVKGISKTMMRPAPAPFSGAMEFQMLHDGGKTLLRLAGSLTIEEPGKEEGAPPTKRERKLLSINDGQFIWTERPRGKSGILICEKSLPSARQGLGEGSVSGPIEGAYAAAGLKGHFEVFQHAHDITVGAKGAVAGRPTTVFNFSLKPEEAEKLKEARGQLPPAKMVAELDDATGATLVVKWANADAAEEAQWDLTATEVKANSGLDKKLFTYTPPEGMQFFDRTQPPEKSAVPKPPEAEKREQ
ncbi:MAG TPA: hypothetical protein VNE39_12715 [Planctomycetota bacterium]|nr:hypothetical protein [Planctomycetota bacterium]